MRAGKYFVSAQINVSEVTHNDTDMVPYVVGEYTKCSVVGEYTNDTDFVRSCDHT